LPGELAASGTLIASNAASAVNAPRPPLPQRAFDRDSPPRFPVPQSALDRVSPRLPPFIRTVRSPFRALARAAYLTDRNGDACRPLRKTWRNLGGSTPSLHPPGG
jgi:hypothetical protein